MVDMTNLDRTARVKLIKKAMKDCGQRITPAAVKKQYRYETGQDYDPTPHRPDPYEAGE